MPHPTPTEKRLTALEAESARLREAIASLYGGLSGFKPLPLAHPEHAALAEILAGDGVERRPRFLPEHRERAA